MQVLGPEHPVPNVTKDIAKSFVEDIESNPVPNVTTPQQNRTPRACGDLFGTFV